MRHGLVATLEPATVLIAGLAVSGYGYSITVGSPTTQSTSEWVAELIGAFLVGVSLAGGIGLGFELVRRRTRVGGWGFGRWTWALMSVALWAVAIHEAIEMPLVRKEMYNDSTDLKTLVALVYGRLNWSLGGICLDFAAFLLARSLVRSPAAGTRDVREWGGRALGLALIAWWLGSGFVDAYRFVRFIF